MLLRQVQENQSHLFDKVSAWFLEALGYWIKVEDIPDSNLFKIKLFSEQHPNGNNLIDVGFGISQILPLVIQLYYDKYENAPLNHLINICQRPLFLNNLKSICIQKHKPN